MLLSNFKPGVKKVFYFIYFIIFLIICSFFYVSQSSIKKIKNFVSNEQKQALDITRIYENVFSQLLYVGRVLEKKFNRQKFLKEFPDLDFLKQLEKNLADLESYIVNLGYFEDWREIKSISTQLINNVTLLHSNLVLVRDYITKVKNDLNSNIILLQDQFRNIQTLIFKILNIKKYAFTNTFWGVDKIYQVTLLSLETEINKLEQVIASENYDNFRNLFLSNVDIHFDIYLSSLENFINELFKGKVLFLEFEIQKELASKVKEFRTTLKTFTDFFHKIKINVQKFEEKFERLYSTTNKNFYELQRLMRVKIDNLWIEISEKSENLVKETANEFISRILRLLVFSFLILFLLAFIPMIILNPIQELKNEFTNISPYKFEVTTKKFFIKEFDELYKTFSSMIIQLKNHIEIHNRYLKTIAQIRIIFSSLYEGILSDDQNFRKSRSEAVHKFFSLLSAHMPNIVHISIFIDENETLKVIEKSYFYSNLEDEFKTFLQKLPHNYLARVLIGSANNIPLPTNNEHETSFTEIPLIPLSDVHNLQTYEDNYSKEHKKDLTKDFIEKGVVKNLKLLLIRLGYKGLIINSSEECIERKDNLNSKALYIYFIFKTQNETLSPSDHLFLSIIAQNISTLLDVSDLLLLSLKQREMSYQLKIAKEIQEKSLPAKIIEDKNFKIDAKVVMSAEVGGDFYDVYKLDNGKIGVIIADVSGKNVSAALLTMLLKASLYSLERKNTLPSQLVTRLNQIMLELLPEGIFITLIYAVFDSSMNKIIWTNAGHTPIIHISQSNSCLNNKKESSVIITSNSNYEIHNVTVLSEPSLPLGIAQANYTDKEITYNKDDRFLFYTDGIIEQRNSKKNNFGVERLVNLLATNPDVELSEIISEVQKFSGKIQLDDDVTLVSVKVL